MADTAHQPAGVKQNMTRTRKPRLQNWRQSMTQDKLENLRTAIKDGKLVQEAGGIAVTEEQNGRAN